MKNSKLLALNVKKRLYWNAGHCTTGRKLGDDLRYEQGILAVLEGFVYLRCEMEDYLIPIGD
jgi:hypothetical protein